MIPDTTCRKCSVQLFQALEVFVATVKGTYFPSFSRNLSCELRRSLIPHQRHEKHQTRQAADLILKVNGEAVTGGATCHLGTVLQDWICHP